MSGLEIAALVAACAWLGALTFVLVLVVRQISLLTLRMSGVVHTPPERVEGFSLADDGPAVAGTVLPLEIRVAAASMLALAAVFIGNLELLGIRVDPPQLDRETPQRWLNKGALTWALMNGVSLGVGATSRIGFWLWYVIPLGAFLFAAPVLGAAIYGAYSVVRGAAVWLLILGIVTGLLREGWEDRFVLRVSTAQTVAAAQLVFVGLVVAIGLGL